MTDNAQTLTPRRAKTPPFLLLAALLFWGWQSGLLAAGAIMGVLLESPRFLRLRWDLTEADFRRIWNFCMLLAFALVMYVFTTNQEGGGMGGLLHPSALDTTRYVGASATAFLRWLPVAFALLLAAQRFSESGTVPLAAISWVVRRWWNWNAGPQPCMDLSYPYFMVCLFSAGIHANQGTQTYFWGQALLVAWALWPLRSRRFGTGAWVGALLLAIGLGFGGQRGITQLQRVLAGLDAQLISSLLRQRTDAAQSATAIGQIGRLKLSARIVIRLEPEAGRPPPLYLREATYRHFFPQDNTWYSGSSRSDFNNVQHELGTESSFTLLRGKTNTSRVSISSYLEGRTRDTGDPEGLLPLPSGVSKLEKLPVFTLKTNNSGAVLATGLGLVVFDAHYGPGATFDPPPDAGTNHLDLAVPQSEIPVLDQVISGMEVSTATDDQKLLAVRKFFRENFSYSVWLGPDKLASTNETALARFLLHSRSGHCEYFATATVLLLREMGIPARYAVGYAVDEKSGHGYVVRERDAHAWCLVWNATQKIWEDFDTTPASWLAEEKKHAPGMQWLSDFWSWLRFQIAKFRWGQANLRQYILWALIPMLAILLYQIIFRRDRKRRKKTGPGDSAGATAWPGLDSEFYELERKLAARGVPRQPDEPLSEWLTRTLSDPALADLRAPARELLRRHYCHRFDPRGLSTADRQALARDSKACLEALSHLDGHPERQG